MSSRETGNGVNWRQILLIGAPIVISFAAVVTIIYFSRKKPKDGNQEIHTSEDVKKDKKIPLARPLTPEKSQEQEEAMKWLLDKKLDANNCFAKKEYVRAVELYSELIDECPPLPSLKQDLAKIYHNRAVTFEKIQEEDSNIRIIEDCTQAINIDPKYVKARIRRAKASEAIGDVMACLKDWTVCGLIQPQVVESDPAYHRVEQLISKKGKEIAEEKMKTHTVLLPSKVAVEDFLNIFYDLEVYTEANMLAWYKLDNISVKSATTTEPPAVAPGENGIPVSDNSIEPIPVSNTDTEVSISESLLNGSSDDVMKNIETEPFWQAISLMRSRQYKNIMQLTTQAVATGCKVFQSHALLVRSVFYLIMCKYPEAIEDTETVLLDMNITPKMRIGAILRRACAREALGEFDQGVNDFELALQIDPKYHGIYLVRSKFYASEEKQDFDKAQSDVNKCLELRPENNLPAQCYYALLKYKLASLSQSQVDMEKVKRRLKDTMKQFPNRPEPIALFAQVLLDVQEFREASEYLGKAIAMDPDNGMLHVYRAQCSLASKGGSALSMGNNPHMIEATKEALEQLEYAIKIDNQCGVAMEVLATLYSHSGETVRAVEYLQMAIKYVRTIHEMASLQTFLLILEYQPVINKEILSCGIDPEVIQNNMRLQM